MTKGRAINVRLPEDLWIAFYKAYPGKGERTIAVKKLIEIAVSLAKDKDMFWQAIREEAEEIYG